MSRVRPFLGIKNAPGCGAGAGYVDLPAGMADRVHHMGIVTVWTCLTCGFVTGSTVNDEDSWTQRFMHEQETGHKQGVESSVQETRTI